MSAPLKKEPFGVLWSCQAVVLVHVGIKIKSKSSRASKCHCGPEHSVQMLTLMFWHTGVEETTDTWMQSKDLVKHGCAASMYSRGENEMVLHNSGHKALATI
jgi:hypothetical protein